MKYIPPCIFEQIYSQLSWRPAQYGTIRRRLATEDIGRAHGKTPMQMCPVEVATVDQGLDVIEAAFRFDLWTQLDNLERMRLIERMDHLSGMARKRFRSE